VNRTAALLRRVFLTIVVSCCAGTLAADDVAESVTADLAPGMLDALTPEQRETFDGLPPAGKLEWIFRLDSPYRFAEGPLVALADSRWFSSISMPGDGAALLELRRWPGDTVLALYALAGPMSAQRDAPAPVPESTLVLAAESTDELARWDGTVQTKSGERPALWFEHKITESPNYLGALLLPGDAGLGEAAVDGLIEELIGVLQRVEVVPAIWKFQEGIPHGSDIRLPIIGPTPADKDETTSPWQVVRATSFSLGLPPGFRARRMDGSVPPPVQIPGGALWMRGRYTDTEGTLVQVGDAEHVAYVAHVSGGPTDWAAGKVPPIGAPGAERVASEPFPLLNERTGAKSARAGRWKDPALDGEWLVFRLRFEQAGIEIGLPVLSGRRSPSLFWIPATWRDGKQAPAPPPVDPAERFGIKFEWLSRGEKQKRPWMEGFLAVPGMRVEMPQGWWPAASLRTETGYPVRMMDQAGSPVGRLKRLKAAELPQSEDEWSGWTEVPRPGIHRAAAAHSDANGNRIYIAHEGHAFLFEREWKDVGGYAKAWERMLGSVQLLRSGRP